MRHLILTVLVMLFVAAAASAAETSSVYIIDDTVNRAAAELVGSGIVLPDGRASQPAQDAHGRDIVWRVHRRSNDERGGEHVFYRQYLIGDGVEAELVGSDLGFHYDDDGRLESVAGSQYRSVMVSNTPQVDTLGAAAKARRALVSFVHNGAATPEPVDPAADLRRGMLQVVQTGGELRYLWRVRFTREREGRRTVYVDAESERVHAVTDAAYNNNCFPNTLSSISATGTPVRATGSRPLGATPIVTPNTPTPGSRGGAYTHEAFWAIGPLLAVHQQVEAGTPLQCNASASNASYSLVALNSVGGVPQYDNPATFNNTTPFKGRVAGDAMHHTRQTMLAFSTMGWNSWNGAWANATVVIESSHAASDQARFIPTDHDTVNNLPPGAAVVVGPSQDYYSLAASLDVIAHEWGHGVIETRAGFPVDGMGATFVAAEMHEGFADVIGHIVERLRHQAGLDNVIEKSGDWTIHEDNAGLAGGKLGYARGAVDDGAGGHFYTRKNNTNPSSAIKSKLHKEDLDFTGADQPHTNGNLLSVVLMLLTDGGKNRMCSRPTPPGFCATVPTVTALGFTKARKVMWDTVARVPSDVNWTSTNPDKVVANHAMQAAYALFKGCNASPVYVPIAEQQAVKDAFTNIGYPPTQAVIQTCQ